MSVTIQTIAKRVGVSKQAVSYALNGKVGQVGEATRLRIQAVARDLGYQPNWRARSFARRRSQIIGLVYGRPADYVETSQMVSGLVQCLAKLDYELLLIPAMGPVSKWAHKLHDGRVDGVLVTHPMPLGLDEFIAQHHLPAVFMNLRSDLNVSQVYFDDSPGVRLVMDHLMGLGHRRIAYFTSLKTHGQHYSNLDRLEAYRQYTQKAGLACQVFEGSFERFVSSFIQASPQERPTAVLAYNDRDAIRLMRVFWQQGVRIPDQISVVGFDGSPMALETIPPLTTVALPLDQLVPHCIELLMAQLVDSHVPAGIQRVCLSESLLVRDSTASPPSDSS